MATTLTDICNLALAEIGEARITDYRENSVLGFVCRSHYEVSRDLLLQSHLWRFAKKRGQLSALAQAPAFGWCFAYQIPSDCLRMWSVNGIEAKLPDADWEIEGGAILTDAAECKVVYISRCADIALYPPLFIKALSLFLAAEMCLEITNSQEKKTALLGEFEQLRSEAAWTDAVESRPRVIPPTAGSRTIAARIGGCRI